MHVLATKTGNMYVNMHVHLCMCVYAGICYKREGSGRSGKTK